MPNYHSWTKSSLDDAFSYFESFYNYAVSSEKDSEIDSFNSSLYKFIEPPFNKKKILDLQSNKYIVSVKVTKGYYKYQSSYRLDIYQDSNKKPTPLTDIQIQKLKEMLLYLEQDDVKESYKRYNIQTLALMAGFIFIVLVLMYYSIYIN